ncbi:unnamed protein product [Adineta steineri]|uniref:Peptidase C14 caspase domain-containing protein n=1 Tax=Adineta steineri TaxID=433720 RepID=A0A819DSB6_9BILA|nr:unnamed protein product [Adineta steineri]CAF3831744.1 unnamed protein product [Adineta steineri]
MQQGLSLMNAPSETIIAFACAAGEAALDETRNNRNGIFTENLLKYIVMPNKDIEEVLKKVSRDVKLQTGGFQKPYRTTSLTEDVFLVTNHSQGQSLPFNHINNNTKWKQHAITIAGGNGHGNQLNQLFWPEGIYIDDDRQTIYIADCDNHRIVEWKYGAKNGQVVVDGNGQENRGDQLNCPADVIVDKKNDSLIICDSGNRRVVRCSHQNGKHGETIISDIDCSRLTMDKNGDLYVSDHGKNEVSRWKQEGKKGTIVAGGHGQGKHLNQLDHPNYIFVNEDHSVYVSDRYNHRVMKWMKGAKEGIIVAGRKGKGDSLTQLSSPQGVIVDHLDNVYVADRNNHRIMRWCKGSKDGSVVVGGNGEGEEPDQLNGPTDLSFDVQGNLYVVDCNNHRIQKFEIDLT